MRSQSANRQSKPASRRNFLIAAAGTVAIATGPAALAETTLAATQPAPNAEPDAALLIFGEELAGVHREIGKINDRFAFIHATVRDECSPPPLLRALADAADDQALRNGQALVSARYLITRAEADLRRDPKALDPALPPAAKKAALDAFRTEVDAAYASAGFDQLEALHRQLTTLEATLVDSIYSTPAEGLGGLVVKLKVIDRLELWQQATPEEDFHRAFLGDTMRNAEQLAGMRPRRGA